MKTWLAVTIFAFSAVAQAKDQSYLNYDANAIKRFKEELNKLHVSPPAVSVPETPVQRPAPTIKAPAGDFQGYWTKSQSGRPIAAFEGIPYAKPPVGPLRFQEAVALPRLSKPFKATKIGSRCTQSPRTGNANNVIGHEDCLFINVYVPLTSRWPENNKLPVIFYIHGGAFVTGSGSSFHPNMLLEKDVVLVTSNYRLGALGFLTTEDGVIPGNLGLKDQVAALRWTTKNILSFGGNPHLITVAGLSAGSASTEFLKLSPLTKGLIHRVISMSGSAYAPWALSPPGEMRHNVDRAAKLLNCPAKPSIKLLACLRKKTAAEIGALVPKMGAWGQTLVVPFKIVVEGNLTGALLPKHPSKLFASSNDIPLLTGVVSEEGSLFGMSRLFNNPAHLLKFDQKFVELTPHIGHLSGPKQCSKKTLETLRRAYLGPGRLKTNQALLATKLFGDVNFMWPAIKSVLSHAKEAKSPVYFYYFNYKESRSLKNPAGVGHARDIAYLNPFAGQANPTNVKMAMLYTELFTNFARDGVPSTSLANVKWTPVGPSEKDIAFLRINSPLDIKMDKNLFPERWTLLKTLLEDGSIY